MLYKYRNVEEIIVDFIEEYKKSDDFDIAGSNMLRSKIIDPGYYFQIINMITIGKGKELTYKIFFCNRFCLFFKKVYFFDYKIHIIEDFSTTKNYKFIFTE